MNGKTALAHRIKMSENEVEKLVVDWMVGRAWTPIRNHVGRFRTEGGQRVAVGVVGTPDWTFKRALRRGVIQICHVECKARGVTLDPGTADQHAKRQLEQIAKLNHAGEPATWVNSLEMLWQWYQDQGLADEYNRVAA